MTSMYIYIVFQSFEESPYQSFHTMKLGHLSKKLNINFTSARLSSWGRSQNKGPSLNIVQHAISIYIEVQIVKH